MARNHYHTLEIDKNASPGDIKRAYRKLAKRYHPDYNPGNKAAEERFLEISIAYETLSNEVLRATYDRQVPGIFPGDSNSGIDHYLHVTASSSVIKSCEEFELSFTYTGEGRYLKKPDLQSFVIASRPYVDFRTVNINGISVKETSITYTISAPIAGKYKIDAASIKIHNKVYRSFPVFISVEQAQCYFSKKHIPSDGKPYTYKMYHHAEAGSANHRFIESKTHIILIPRSRKAEVLHKTGMFLKLTFALWGAVVATKLSANIFWGIITGSLYGALSAYLLYFLNGVRPKFYFSDNNNVVKEYALLGFRKYGNMMGSNSITMVFSFLTRLMY